MSVGRFQKKQEATMTNNKCDAGLVEPKVTLAPPKPVRAETTEQLRAFADRLKRLATPDQPLETYSRTKEDADRLRNGDLTSAEIDAMTISADIAPAGVLFNRGRFFSVVITKDEWHNHKYHLSLAEIVPGDQTMHRVDDETASNLMDAFFDEWRSVPNPGKIEEISHFAGN